MQGTRNTMNRRSSLKLTIMAAMAAATIPGSGGEAEDRPNGTIQNCIIWPNTALNAAQLTGWAVYL